MNYATPESKGISSAKILEFIQTLEKNQLNTHNVIIAKGDSIVFEKYWAPFHKDYLHRMYSVTKSFVSLAIGFLEQDGLICLDDPICKYFPKETENQHDENMRNQTIRHMLMMSTAKMGGPYWFWPRITDRVAQYFDNQSPLTRPSGTIFSYDSSGSFIMGALVERITGKTLMDYLREKMFRKIGVSEEAYCLKCPGGHSWSDSAILCKPTDLLKTSRFTLNRGKWNGEQILNEQYVVDATSKQIDNNFNGGVSIESYGYGYQFWRTRDNSYFFNGMGCQFAVCSPDSDMILIYNGDNQGNSQASHIIINSYFDLVENTAQEQALPENPEAQNLLNAETADLKLAVAQGDYVSDTQKDVDGVTYTLNDNPMGITKVQLSFNGNRGVLKYTNAQGDKELPFGLGYNEFSDFPEEGYSDEIGSVSKPGHKYHCAASAAWTERSKLYIKVQIIDKYFGTLNITMGFRDGLLGLYMVKTAEDFLGTYDGIASGKAN